MAEFTSHMSHAIAAAKQAAAQGEVPVGAAIIAPNGQLLASAHNLTRTNHDPSAHAETLAIRAACDMLKTDRLPNHDLYVTLEPCPACAAIISAARIRRLYFGAYDPKSGGVEQGPRIFDHPQAHHKPEVYGGIEETACAALLTNFFKTKR